MSGQGVEGGKGNTKMKHSCPSSQEEEGILTCDTVKLLNI